MTTLLFLLALASILGGLGVSIYQSIKASDETLKLKWIPAILSVIPAVLFSLYLVRPANLEAIKARTAQFEVQGLVKQRELVRAGIENDVRGRLAAQHVILEDMSITNFSFSNAYEQAIEQKQVAEQNAEKAKNTLEQTKIEAEQAAAKAKGEADARVAQAQGEAQSILVEAQAKAKAQELQRVSLTPELPRTSSYRDVECEVGRQRSADRWRRQQLSDANSDAVEEER